MESSSTDPLVTVMGSIGAVIASASLVIREWVKMQRKPNENTGDEAAKKSRGLDESQIDKIAERVLAVFSNAYGMRASHLLQRFEKLESSMEHIGRTTHDTAHSINPVITALEVLKDRLHRKE